MVCLCIISDDRGSLGYIPDFLLPLVWYTVFTGLIGPASLGSRAKLTNSPEDLPLYMVENTNCRGYRVWALFEDGLPLQREKIFNGWDSLLWLVGS